MKNWWLKLSLREQQTVSIGAILLSLFFIYQIIFATLGDHVQTLRQKIHTQQALLSWMQTNNNRIQALAKNPPTPSHQTSAALLGVIQESVNNSPIAHNISQLQQSENNSVQIHLQKVDFDALMQWLATICQQQQLVVTEMTVIPLAVGIVEADIKLG